MVAMLTFMAELLSKKVDEQEIGCLDATEIYKDGLLGQLKYF